MRMFSDYVTCLFGTGGFNVRQDSAFAKKAMEFSQQVAKDIGFHRDFVCVGEIPENTLLSEKAEQLLGELESIKSNLLV